MFHLLNEFLVILPEDIPERHFFLKELTSPGVIWGIRGVCIVAGVAAVLIYYIMKNKKGE